MAHRLVIVGAGTGGTLTANRLRARFGDANKISFARLDGMGGADLNTAGATISGPNGIAIDAAAGRAYFANQTGKRSPTCAPTAPGAATCPP